MPPPDLDWTLVALLDGISTNDGRVRMVVFCGGLAVSGTAVPDEVFFEKIDLSVAGEEVARQRAEGYSELASIKQALDRDDISLNEREALLSRADELQRTFISMVDVTILGAGPTPLKVPAWRGRLSQISGWVLGALDEPE